jgi:uncharacterized delta-60 repeat protein
VKAAPGDADPSFGSGGTVINNISYVTIHKVLVQPDGKIIVVGSRKIAIQFGQPQLLDYLFVRRYTSTGVLESSYPGLKRGIGVDAALQPDGKLVVIGHAPNTIISPFGGTMDVNSPAVWRFNTNATTDTTFGNGGTQLINTTEKGNFHIGTFGGSIFVAYGSSSLFALNPSYKVSRLSATGSIDYTLTMPFTFVGNESAFAMRVDPANGDIVAGGPRNTDQNTVLRRYNQDGAVVTGFGVNGMAVVPDCTVPNPELRIKDIEIEPNGSILVHRYIYSTFSWVNISRQTSNGAPDLLCKSVNLQQYIGTNILMQPDGKFLFFVGVFGLYWRHFPDGTFDTGIQFPNAGAAAVIQPDQKIVSVSSDGIAITITRRLLD